MIQTKKSFRKVTIILLTSLCLITVLLFFLRRGRTYLFWGAVNFLKMVPAASVMYVVGWVVIFLLPLTFLFFLVYLARLNQDSERSKTCRKCGGKLVRKMVKVAGGKRLGKFNADVCASCKEEYFSEDTIKQILEKQKRGKVKKRVI